MNPYPQSQPTGQDPNNPFAPATANPFQGQQTPPTPPAPQPPAPPAPQPPAPPAPQPPTQPAYGPPPAQPAYGPPPGQGQPGSGLTAEQIASMLGDPAKQAPKGPRLEDLYNRLLIIVPKRLETVNNRLKPGTTQDRLTANVIVLDGGVLHYGGNPNDRPPRPHDKVTDVPVRFVDMFISSVGLISQTREKLAERLAGTQSFPGVLGRLGVGEKKGDFKPPWLLFPVSDEERIWAGQVLAARTDLLAES